MYEGLIIVEYSGLVAFMVAVQSSICELMSSLMELHRETYARTLNGGKFFEFARPSCRRQISSSIIIFMHYDKAKKRRRNAEEDGGSTLSANQKQSSNDRCDPKSGGIYSDHDEKAAPKCRGGRR